MGSGSLSERLAVPRENEPRILRAGRRGRLIALFLGLLVLFATGNVLAATQPGAQKLQNADFENTSHMAYWTGQGNSWGAESCCGQHETPFWGRGNNPYPAHPEAFTGNFWDGYVAPNASGSTQLYQWTSNVLSSAQRYRLSAWVFTSGVTAYLERYAPSLGALVQCASTSDTASTPLSCEFTNNVTESIAAILEQGYAAGHWAVADDWTLTPIITVPRNWLADTWSSLPVPYYVDSSGYPMRTDIATWNWNGAMGKTMLQKTGDANQGNTIRVFGYYDSTWPAVFGSAPNRKDGNGVKTIQINKWYLDVWNSNTYRYGFEAREAIIGHELGHALGLEHVQNECELMNPWGNVFPWACNVFKPTSGDVDGMRTIYP